MVSFSGVVSVHGITSMPAPTPLTGYDIFVIAGQSNTHFGEAQSGEPVLD